MDIISGKTWIFGENIDTDVIIPGRYLRTFNPQDLADHVLEGERPDFTKNVQKGDIILHGCNAQVQAVSIARDKCYDCIQPSELRTEELWEQAGRRIDCEYLVLDRSIRTADYVDDILRLCNVKYAPFDKDGNGNMGYLYEINRELARIFLRGIVKANPQIANVDYISELLAEK